MKPLNTELIAENIYEINSLIVLYRNYVESYPKNPADYKNTQREMKVTKEQILKQLVDLKKVVRKMELEVVPKT